MLSEKYKYYINCKNYRYEFLEGSTASGKTTVGISWKYIPAVLRSPKKLHIIFGKTAGVIEKNIIQQDNGILYYWGHVFRYYGNGNRDYKFPHLRATDSEGREKVILCIGYDTKSSWLNVLGGQYGCIFIDEINTANIDAVREVSSRCDWLVGTLNPDNPDLPVYQEYINKAVIDSRYAADVPEQIVSLMDDSPEKRDNWGYFFFSMDDNISLSDDDRQRKRESLDPATKIYKNKILGLRCRAVGLVFPSWEQALERGGSARILKRTLGVDTSYSSLSADEIAVVLGELDTDGVWHVRRCWGWNNRDNPDNPLAPSDTVARLISIAESEGVREVYIDSADQATLTEAYKAKRTGKAQGIQFVGAYKSTQIVDRINLMNGWIWTDKFKICEQGCAGLERELGVYSWLEGKDIPEDANDHYINACQYGWLPYKEIIGK